MLTRSSSADALQEAARRMSAAMRHRGPNDAGTWTDEHACVALGHARLAILDLSPAGHQPMVSNSGRYVIAFNGEIYNHLDLRRDLQATGVAPAWRGHSDTETLLAGVEHWGLEPTLQRSVGMFAIALWDRQTGTLALARDRFGEKPLYYGWSQGAFLFGSELKALRAHSGFDAPICRDALAQYLRFMYVPAPRSIYHGIFKLEPGCMLTISGTPPAAAPAEPLRPGKSHGGVAARRWWSLAEAVEAGAQNPITDEVEALHLLEDQLSQAVGLQSLADVPLGAFLSGGVDSSTIVALMQQRASRPVKTFTIGFDEAGFDESPHARAVAEQLRTDHHEMRVTAQMAQDVIPTLPWMYDEPFADSSQIPTHLVCKAARQQVTVALSGDAGDELFGGYNRYFWGPRIWQRMGRLPHPLRQTLARGMQSLSPARWDTLLTRAGVVRPGEKLHKLGRVLQGARNMDDFYLSLVSEWTQSESLVIGTQPDWSRLPRLPAIGVSDDRARMMYWDSLTYLPDDILTKVDRASMAISLETRVPFLDHRVAELAWRLPLHMKIRGNQGKWALRQVLYKHVPRELIERPKAGFAIPIGQWLRGPLREWAEALLDEKLLGQQAYLNPQPIRLAWEQHLSGHSDRTTQLWGVLMFQAWLEASN